MSTALRILKTVVATAALAALLGGLTGCQSRYWQNRTYDLCDVFQAGVGATFENPQTGPWPPSLGVHAQVTDFVNLGALHFSGAVAEMDGRGFFVGCESRTRLGFLPIQMIHLDQDYETACANYFKSDDTLWAQRMNTLSNRFAQSPAKSLDYSFWSDEMHRGTPLFHRGWQYWGNTALAVGVCDPFFTHFGLKLNLGVDISEFSDLLLGFTTLDFKRDDLTELEFGELQEMAR